MRKNPLQVLVVEDNASDVRLIREMFSKESPGSITLTHLMRMRDAEIRLAKGGVDIVLLDMGLPDEHGIKSLRRSLAAAPGVPVIVLTGLDDDALAIEAMREGAQDYLIKGEIENRALPRALRHAIERHQFDRRLRDQQFYTRSLIESNIDALMTTDPSGVITDVNRQMEALTGCTRDELIGAPFKQYFTDPDRAEAGINRVLQTGEITDYELTARARHGSEVVVSYNATTFHDRDGKLQGVFASARDVTERRRIERALQERNSELKSANEAAERAQASAERANAAKSDFLSAMSHEIRTPMNAILGMADVLWESNLDTEQRKYLEVFRRAGSTLLMLINNLLDVAKIEAGHLELERVRFSIAQVMEQSIELIAGKARAKGLTLQSHLAPDVAPSLMGDPARLKQIVLNLLDNAVKFTESGRVTLSVRNYESGGRNQIECEVSDTGIGIAPGKLETIFDDFTQADGSTTRKHGGTGLGLGISRRLVNAMEGHLTASSVEGVGSTFRLTAPFDRSSENAPEVRATCEDLHGKRVLVIDDNATSRLILSETLEAWGLESETFERPEDGLVKLTEVTAGDHPFSLALVDSRIPGMNGFEIALEIKRICANLPVVMLTSDARPGDSVRSAECGLAGYAVKPLSRAALLRLVCEALGVREAPEPGPPAGPNRAEEVTMLPARILIVEDSADNRLLIDVYLKGSPYQLTFEENGRDAFERNSTSDFDLILMDIQMPVMDGLAATRAIREQEQARGIPPVPIVALTANAGVKDVEKSGDAGCTAHVSKPVSKFELLSTIEKFARRPSPEPFAPKEALEPVNIEIPPGFDELSPRYLAKRRNEFPEMLELLAASDFARIATLTHNLKGTGSGYGFPEISRLGKSLEQLAKQRDGEALRVQLAELGNYLDRVNLVSKT